MFNVDHCRHFVKGSRKRSLKRTKNEETGNMWRTVSLGKRNPHELRYLGIIELSDPHEQ